MVKDFFFLFSFGLIYHFSRNLRKHSANQRNELLLVCSNS